MSGDHTRVRPARPEDEGALFGLCTRLHRENGLLRMSEPIVRSLLQRAFDEATPLEARPIIGVAGGDRVEGSVCLVVSRLWYSDRPVIEELWNYVAPEHRRTSHAKDLVAYAKHIADAVELPLIIGILSNHRTEAKVRLYCRELGLPAGAFWLHGARTGEKGNQ